MFVHTAPEGPQAILGAPRCAPRPQHHRPLPTPNAHHPCAARISAWIAGENTIPVDPAGTRMSRVPPFPTALITRISCDWTSVGSATGLVAATALAASLASVACSALGTVTSSEFFTISSGVCSRLKSADIWSAAVALGLRDLRPGMSATAPMEVTREGVITGLAAWGAGLLLLVVVVSVGAAAAPAADDDDLTAGLGLVLPEVVDAMGLGLGTVGMVDSTAAGLVFGTGAGMLVDAARMAGLLLAFLLAMLASSCLRSAGGPFRNAG